MRMKGVFLLIALSLVFASTSVLADSPGFFGGVRFGDSEKTVKEKVIRHFSLKRFETFHRYTIGKNTYIVLFEYEGTAGLRRIKVFSPNTPISKYRKKIPAYWKDLEGFSDEYFGPGEGKMPHLTELSALTMRFTKRWEKEGEAALLGVVHNEYGFHVVLILEPAPSRP